MAVKKGDIVRYVHHVDGDLNDEIPNISTAIVTKVRPAQDGKPENVAVKVFHASGDFVDQYVVYDEARARGSWHYPPVEA